MYIKLPGIMYEIPSPIVQNIQHSFSIKLKYIRSLQNFITIFSIFLQNFSI